MTAILSTCFRCQAPSAECVCDRQPERGPLRVCECGEWTYSPMCGPCRRPAPPMPATAIHVRTACGHLVEEGCNCAPWRQPVEERPGCERQNGLRRKRVPIFMSGRALYGGNEQSGE